MKIIEIVETTPAPAPAPAPTFSQKNPVISGKMSIEQKYFGKVAGGSILLKFFQFIGGLYFIYDFIKQKERLNNDFNQFKKSNGAVDKNNIFSGSASVEDAQTKYYEQIEQLVGKVAASVVLAWSRGGFQKILGGLQILLRFIPVVGWVPAMVVGVLKYALTLSPALTLLWFEKSNDFLTNFIKKILYSIIGWSVTEGWNTVISLGAEGLSAIGVKNIMGKPIDKLKKDATIPTDPNSLHGLLKGGNGSFDSNKGPRIGGIVATDKDGYLRIDTGFYNTPQVINDISLTIQDGKVNPLDKIPKRPNAIYPRWLPNQETFTLPDGFVDQWEKFKGKV
jgi:hypothetical protein